MSTNASKNRILFAVFTTAIIALTVLTALMFRRGRSLSHLIVGDIVLILLLSMGAMAVALKESLKITCYDYRNIALIGGILFAGVLCAVLLRYWILGLAQGGVDPQESYRLLLAFPRRFSYYAVFFIMVLSLLLAVSNIALIRHEGLCLQNALSILFAAFYIGGTVLVYFLADVLMDRVFLPTGFADSPVFLVLHAIVPLFLLLFLCYLECILVGIMVMGYIAARQKPALDKDFIIILGCSIDKRGGLYPLLKGRVHRAVRFAWEQEIATGKPLKYVPSGGQGKNEIMSEGAAIEFYLLTHGAESWEVFPEKQSRNTWENMCYSKKIIDSFMPGARVAFSTTNYHMLRSGILARRAGMDAEGIAGDTKWYFWPNGFVREIFGILKLNLRAHCIVASALALVCAGVGCLGYISHFL